MALVGAQLLLNYYYAPLAVCAKGYQIVATSASGNASGIVISIRVSPRARRLEYPRVCRRLARLRTPEPARTTISGGVESKARAFTRNHAPLVVGPHLKPHRAHHVEIADAPRGAALAGTFKRRNGDCEVVAVHEAHIVKVLLVAECDLGQGCRWGAAETVAEERAAAVAGCAASAAGGVEGAAVAAPDPA